MKSNKTLFVLNFVPKHDQNSGDLRLYEILKILGSHHVCELWLPTFLFDDPNNYRYIEGLRKLNIEILKNFKDLLTLLKKRNYEFVFFEFFMGAIPGLWVTQYIHPETITIVDSVDVHFVREEMALKYNQISSRKFRRNKKLELSVYSKNDATFVVSEQDKEILRNNSIPNNKLFVVPNIVSNKVSIDYSQSSKEIVFVGGFNHPPNLDGILWFVESIWPKIIVHESSAKLTIVGSNPPIIIQELDGKNSIRVTGYVEDIEPFLRRATISIAPLRIGGGMKGKINEALSYSLPVVTTSIGAQGFNAISGVHMIIADEPESFAEAVITLLNNRSLRELIGRNGNELNRKICSPGLVEEMLLKALDSLKENKESQKTSANQAVPQFLFRILFFFKRLQYFTYADNKYSVLVNYFQNKIRARNSMNPNKL